jgi:hypothetical protein
MRPLGVLWCSGACVIAVLGAFAPQDAIAEGRSEAKSCAVAKKPFLESLFELRGKAAKAVAKAASRKRPHFERVSAPSENAAAASAPEAQKDAAEPMAVADDAYSNEPVAGEALVSVPVPGDEPALDAPAGEDAGAPAMAAADVAQASSAPDSPDSEPVVPSDGSTASVGQVEAPPRAEAPTVSPPLAAVADEEAPVVVTGAVVLGLLPYTIAEGAFGLGTTVGLDAYSANASVGFGPTAALGVTNWLTLGAAVPFASSANDGERLTGLGNVGVSAQFGYFNDAASGIALAATPGISLPSPSAAASSDVSPDLKASGAVNLGAVAVNLTARGAVKVPTNEAEQAEAMPVFDSALSVILVDDTVAPFLEGGISVSNELVPMGAAGLNWAPGGGALLTLGVPVAFHEGEVKPGMSFTAYFETDLFGHKSGVSKVSATAIAKAR